MSVTQLDPFRTRDVPENATQQSLVKSIQDSATELYELFYVADKYDARSAHLARVKLEESIMWVLKGITSVSERKTA